MPLHAFLAGDTLGVLVLVHDYEPVATIAERLMQAASTRVTPFEHAIIAFNGKHLDPLGRIGESGLEALDRVDVRRP